MKKLALAIALCSSALALSQTTGLPSRKGYIPVQGVYTVPGTVFLLDVVYATGSGAADKADGTNPAKVPAVGIVVQKPDSTTAVVQYVGEVDGFGSLVPGLVYYVSTTPGQLTSTAPTANGSVVQKVGVAKTATVLMLSVDTMYTVL